MTVTSPIKIKSNRVNALKSTGPKTAAGIQRASRNSLKHGLLSKAIVISDGDSKENQEELDALLSELYADLQPNGKLEEMLVERIVVSYWRLRRAIRAETAEIQLNTDSATRRLKERLVSELLNELRLNRFLDDRLFPTLSSLQEFTYALRDTIDEIASDREICSETQGKLLNSLYAENTVELTKSMQEILWHIHDVNKYSNWPRSKYGKECRNAAIGYFEELDENARIKLREMEAQASQRPEHLHEQFLSRGSLPNENGMDKILRYETAIERQLYRAIAELERLQNRRTGEVLSIFVLMMQTQFGETKPRS